MTSPGDELIDAHLREFMKSIAFALDQILNGKDVEKDPGLRHTGFVLLLFPFNDESGRCNYISNGAKRADVIKLFKERIKRFEELEAKET